MTSKKSGMQNFVLTKEIAYNKMQRMAYEIIENNFDEKELIIAGIRENGAIIANILYEYLSPIFKGKLRVIDITLDKKVVIIIDDVSNSGRTLLYAVKPFLNFYPRKIQTLVLVERSYQLFPLSPDYVGMSIATALSEKIIVEIDGKEILGARIEDFD